jgi:hypothetical protein
MSNVANWSYTAKATIWPFIAEDDYNQKTFSAPLVIDCDYMLGGTAKSIGGMVSNIGINFVIKNTFWTEYAVAKKGDFILLGEHSDLDPLALDADEIRHITQYADTFDRLADDFALITAA